MQSPFRVKHSVVKRVVWGENITNNSVFVTSSNHHEYKKIVKSDLIKIANIQKKKKNFVKYHRCSQTFAGLLVNCTKKKKFAPKITTVSRKYFFKYIFSLSITNHYDHTAEFSKIYTEKVFFLI